MLSRLVTMMGGTAALNPVSGPNILTMSAAVQSPGACTLHDPWILSSCVIRLSWTYDTISYGASTPSDYTQKIYRDNVLIATRAISGVNQSYDDTMTGWVEGAEVSVWNANFKYRVDVVRKSDAVVVSTRSATRAVTIGRCH